jgi:NhaP-type Na+/H+ or K+/H+ antiporter
MFVEEMGGGAIAGLGGGYGLLWLLRHVRVPQSVYPVLALMAVLVTFGGAQTIGSSGFLAAYVMGVILALSQFKAHRALVYAAETFAWLAQITLFLLLGLLVTPHRLVPIIAPILGITAVLLVGGAAGRRADLPDTDPGPGWGSERSRSFRRCLWGSDRVAGSPGMDDLTGRTDPGLWKQ